MSKKYAVYTSFVFFLFCGHLLWWHSIDTRPPVWDASVHLNLASIYKDFLYTGKPMLSPWVSFYPPFYHLSLVPALSFGHMSEAHAVVTHIFYCGILLVGFWLLAAAAKVEEEAAILATLLTLSGSLVLWLQLHPLIDFALLSWTTLSMGLLASTDGFSRRRTTLLWGVAMGCGELIKPSFFLFFGLPCLFLLNQLRGVDLPARKIALKNFGLGCAVGILICLPWYFWQGATFLQFLVGQVSEQGVAKNDPSFRSLAGWLWHIKALKAQLGWACLLVTLAGIVLALAARQKNALLKFLFLWWLSGYVAVTFVHNKDTRYSLPYIPALTFMASIGWLTLAQRGRLKIPLLLGAAGLFIGNALQTDPPRKEDWHHAAIGAWIAKTHDVSQPFPTLSVIANHPLFFGRNIRWTLRGLGLSIEPSSPGDSTTDFTEYIVTKSGDPGPETEQVLGEWRKLEQSGRAFHNLFAPLAKFPLPDESVATLYQRNPRHVFALNANREDLNRHLREILQKEITGPFDLTVQTSPANLRRGRLENVRITGGPWTIRGIPIARADVVLDEAWLNLYRVWDENKLGLLALRDLSPDVEIDGQALQDALGKKVKGVSNFQIAFADQGVNASARWHSIPLQLSVGLRVREHPAMLVASLRGIRVMHIPIPALLLGKLHAYALPLYPISSFPVNIRLHAIETVNNVLKIS